MARYGNNHYLLIKKLHKTSRKYSNTNLNSHLFQNAFDNVNQFFVHVRESDDYDLVLASEVHSKCLLLEIETYNTIPEYIVTHIVDLAEHD